MSLQHKSDKDTGKLAFWNKVIPQKVLLKFIEEKVQLKYFQLAKAFAVT